MNPVGRAVLPVETRLAPERELMTEPGGMVALACTFYFRLPRRLKTSCYNGAEVNF